MPPVQEETDADDEGDDVTAEEEPAQPEVETTIVSQSVGFHPYTVATLPFVSNEEYLNLVSSMIKILTGDKTLQEWITKDFAHHQVRCSFADKIVHLYWVWWLKTTLVYGLWGFRFGAEAVC